MNECRRIVDPYAPRLSGSHPGLRAWPEPICAAVQLAATTWQNLRVIERFQIGFAFQEAHIFWS